MDLFVALATFAVIFPAELPDKSMFASVVLGTRFKSFAVWVGLAGAFLTHVLIAVTAGRLVLLLPERLVAAVVTLFFLGGALYLLFLSESAPPEEIDEGIGNEEIGDEGIGDEGIGEVEGQERSEGKTAANLSAVRTMAMSYGVIFVSEWGDLTQLATMNLAARYEDPVSVAIGATAALWLVSALGVLLGKRLIGMVPLRQVRRGAGVVLLGLAAWSLFDLLTA